MFDGLRQRGFDLRVCNHAEAILRHDFPDELAEFLAALEDFEIPVEELIGSGGGEAPSTQRLRRTLSTLGWDKHNFVVETKIDGVLKEAISHEIDHVRGSGNGVLALEIEWNNKDPFFDRDLENFHRLHAQSVISVGMIVTRGASLQNGMRDLIEGFLRDAGIKSETGLLELGMKERTARQRAHVAGRVAAGEDFEAAFAHHFVADKFGAATTHWSKLEDRVSRGVGNPCPLLLIGLPLGVVRRYSAAEL